MFAGDEESCGLNKLWNRICPETKNSPHEVIIISADTNLLYDLMNLIHIDAQWPKAFKQLDLDSTKAHLMIQKGVNGV